MNVFLQTTMANINIFTTRHLLYPLATFLAGMRWQPLFQVWAPILWHILWLATAQYPRIHPRLSPSTGSEPFDPCSWIRRCHADLQRGKWQSCFFSAQMSFLFCVEILLLLWVSVPGWEETLRDAHEQFGNILNPECRGLAGPCPAQIFNLGVHIQWSFESPLWWLSILVPFQVNKVLPPKMAWTTASFRDCPRGKNFWLVECESI